jgi:hypothetical protein
MAPRTGEKKDGKSASKKREWQLSDGDTCLLVSCIFSILFLTMTYWLHGYSPLGLPRIVRPPIQTLANMGLSSRPYDPSTVNAVLSARPPFSTLRPINPLVATHRARHEKGIGLPVSILCLCLMAYFPCQIFEFVQ